VFGPLLNPFLAVVAFSTRHSSENCSGRRPLECIRLGSRSFYFLQFRSS
jgi:hypothetical protein